MGPPLPDDVERGQGLGRMPAITMYPGRRFGRSRNRDPERRLVCDATDVALEIPRPRGEQMRNRPAANSLVTEQLPCRMQTHERRLADNAVAIGGQPPTLAALVVTALWHRQTDKLRRLRP